MAKIIHPNGKEEEIYPMNREYFTTDEIGEYFVDDGDYCSFRSPDGKNYMYASRLAFVGEFEPNQKADEIYRDWGGKHDYCLEGKTILLSKNEAGGVVNWYFVEDDPELRQYPED